VACSQIHGTVQRAQTLFHFAPRPNWLFNRTSTSFAGSRLLTLALGLMTMRILFIAIIAFALTPSFAFAEECTDRPECWPEGSAMHTGLLLVEQQRAAEASLQRKHKELVKLVGSSSSGEVKADERLLAALQTQQLAWLKYRTEECELVGSLTGAGGSWPSTYTNQCEVNHTQQRLRRVQSAIRCIKRSPEDKRLFAQNDCLQQLAPLTNK